MAQLLFFRGDEKLIEYRLSGGRMSIGRADSCDVALPGEAISRTHCFVVQRDGAYEVIDRSRHGITVDGRSVKRAEITDGAELGIGGFRVLLKTEQSTPAPTAEVIADRGHELVMDADNSAVVVERSCSRSSPDRTRASESSKEPHERRAPSLGHSLLGRIDHGGPLLRTSRSGASWLSLARVRSTSRANGCGPSRPLRG